MITVSATDQNDNLASFSSWGPMVDVAAPGVTVQTTLWNSGYGWGTGPRSRHLSWLAPWR